MLQDNALKGRAACDTIGLGESKVKSSVTRSKFFLKMHELC